MHTHLTPGPRSHRPRYAWHFLLTTALTIVMLCGMTLFYGFRELQNTAQDMAAAVMKTAEAQKGRRGPARADVLAQQAVDGFRDAELVRVCAAGQCAIRRAPEGLHMSAGLLDDIGLTCGTKADPASGDLATVCMAIDDVVEDISRDVIVLLVAQAVGFGIWLAASRRFSARRRVWNARVALAATTDPTTGLLNRVSFREVLGTVAARGDEAWLVSVGIDELKSINQLHGSQIGDQVILTVAERIKGLKGTHTHGRLGGDEFAFLVDGCGPAALERALFQLREAMSPPVQCQGVVLSVTVCAGAVPVEHGAKASELKRRANVALRAAKKIGADSQSIFSEAYDIELRNTHQLRLDLMAAVDREQVELVYQPIVDARGQVVMAEALARWRHPTLGAIAPDVFIAVAESSGMIHMLGIALLKRACADLLAARSRGMPLRRIAVNVSPAQLNNPDLAQIVMSVVRDAGLMPADIELELTESAAMASRNDATQQLHELAEAGFAISIDDFGTGYSSLSRLQTLPIGKLKIDRSFVQACDQRSGAVLLEAMMDLSRRLELSCVAEGVETEAQMAWLRDRGCQLFQGYLIGKPMPLDQLVGLGFRIPLGRLPLDPSPAPLIHQGVHSL
ncbi:bifunctional diguanylate cyclase/phosphodiesterase [Paucibacter sp. R3-3]|uniref:Bifunctional diguanylate cyclase/phosphodiesterase n=1 Tax=Roseateles agri TaxID=3098619 RepID=A0ABU5DGB9_9BURK|nr:bifunctional diguanylate cyclase/phosphodiesterase [Paucibacter sp. R3-3]MDY0745330.1 bifunctional diguanylate cyclase/phosphodiesterase [Paucibacter sp. R3-3]